MKDKEQLRVLIESDIRAVQLMNVLEHGQIEVDLFFTDNSTLIFESMDISAKYHTDELYSTYFLLVGKGINLKNDNGAFERLILQVYNYLLKYSELCAILEESGISTTIG
ncbi:hypothetical protein [uncultured Flavobacterium sp.]|uniref:hypothetical protein n=1 Tax=uncultured Flavobacterium sp. TaxID=165435 RepID=UPI000964F1D0|nr:hypothetical protein [uncultured Flavobacterium sp.]OJX38800.1 MAG: hypothetical protein BGO87_08465 [Flavobacteriia bacterium 40-80]